MVRGGVMVVYGSEGGVCGDVGEMGGGGGGVERLEITENADDSRSRCVRRGWVEVEEGGATPKFG